MSQAQIRTDPGHEKAVVREPGSNRPEQDEDIQSILGLDRNRSRVGLRRFPILLAIVAVAATIGLAYWWFGGSGGEKVEFITVPASRGDLLVTVAAAGSLEPVNQVEIGSELSGTVREVLVGYNDHVEAGEVLARLDTAKLEADVKHARAALKMAAANLSQAEATVAEAKGNLERTSSLFGTQHQSSRELEAAQATYERAVAARDSAAASVDLAKADLEADETQLAKTEIKSPINGVILERDVEPGQTVAATLQAPVLFTIAEDLSKMDLLVDIDEADVAKVHEGATASFVVEAYPRRDFAAEVTQLRYAPNTASGVVTYEAVLSVDNSDLALRPGMTATATIISEKVTDALRVPNAALRYSLNRQQASTEFRGPFAFLLSREKAPAEPGEQPIPQGQRRIWILKQGEAVGVLITPGVTDGSWTEVVDGNIGEGALTITDSATTE